VRCDVPILGKLRGERLTGEQVLALTALGLITLLIVITLVVAVVSPPAVATLTPIASMGVTALASLVRRHDVQDAPLAVQDSQDAKAP